MIKAALFSSLVSLWCSRNFRNSYLSGWANLTRSSRSFELITDIQSEFTEGVRPNFGLNSLNLPLFFHAHWDFASWRVTNRSESQIYIIIPEAAIHRSNIGILNRRGAHSSWKVWHCASRACRHLDILEFSRSARQRVLQADFVFALEYYFITFDLIFDVLISVLYGWANACLLIHKMLGTDRMLKFCFISRVIILTLFLELRGGVTLNDGGLILGGNFYFDLILSILHSLWWIIQYILVFLGHWLEILIS